MDRRLFWYVEEFQRRERRRAMWRRVSVACATLAVFFAGVAAGLVVGRIV